jgi:prepilin-type N-terminal cleavage/methylation domain-containing protein
MKQRKGFTLIELMIVIAIIIILAAIAIPNYLRMTDRARRSRVAGDFASTATALEAYSVDWGVYPMDATADPFGKANPATHILLELAGTGAVATETNVADNTTLTGEPGGIEYIKIGTLTSMYNPFIPDESYYYVSSPTTANHWALAVQYNTDDIIYRTDGTTDLTQIAAGTDVTGILISELGAVTP